MLTFRSRCGSIVKAMKRIEVSARGWLNYFEMADMNELLLKLRQVPEPDNKNSAPNR